MRKSLLLFICIGLSICYIHADDTIKTRIPQFFTVNAANGRVFPTNDFVSGDKEISNYYAFALKYGFSARGNNWKDFAYGMPYGGIGLYTARFSKRKKDIGSPFSIYFFQGAQLFKLTRKLTINYEWNLGASFNWKYYDAFDNPENIAIGSSVNIHAGGNLYFNWRLSRHFDLHAGAGFTHFSNGAASRPNKGLNMLAYFVELSYHFNRKDVLPNFDGNFTPPTYEKHIDHDLMILISSRQAKVDTLYTGLVSEYTQRSFKVLGLSYAHMFSNSYRFKWGPSIEAVYDESSGVTSWREKHPETGKLYDRVKLGRTKDRFSLGVSMKGEVSMPVYSIFAHLGYDVIEGNKSFQRFYQILGVKVYINDNFFGTFGIRANNFGKAQYLYWNLGYTFEQYKKKK